MFIKVVCAQHVLFFKGILFCICFLTIQAQASLMITPTRVVMDEKHRSAEVTLLNNSNTTKVYRIHWVEMRQTENGGYEPVESPVAGDFIASTMIRHSPRKVTIEPKKYQRIKLSLRMPANLPDGEYRSHLKMKVTDTGVTAEDIPYGGEGQQMRLIPKLSFAIPIIVRKGVVNTEAAIERVGLDDKDPEKLKLNVDISHKGAFSSYGKLFAYMRGRGGSTW